MSKFEEAAKTYVQNRIRDLKIEPFMVHAQTRTILHLIPAKAFTNGINYNIRKSQVTNLQPICPDHGSLLDQSDIIIMGGGDPQNGYGCVTTIKRDTGIIEAVDATLLNNSNNTIVFKLFKDKIDRAVEEYLKILNDLNIEYPLFVSLQLINVDGINVDNNDNVKLKFTTEIVGSEWVMEEVQDIHGITDRFFQIIIGRAMGPGSFDLI